MVNSRDKGARGERQFAAFLRARGIDAERGQQHAGGADSPDVKHSLDGFHFEVKRTERFSLYKALEQAERDAGAGHIPVVAHRQNRKDWVVVLRAEHLLDLVVEEDLSAWAVVDEPGRRPRGPFERLIMDLCVESERQDRKFPWPRSRHLLQTPDDMKKALTALEPLARLYNDDHGRRSSWLSILAAEVGELASAETVRDMRAQAIQVATVALAFCQALQEKEYHEDRRR